MTFLAAADAANQAADDAARIAVHATGDTIHEDLRLQTKLGEAGVSWYVYGASPDMGG